MPNVLSPTGLTLAQLKERHEAEIAEHLAARPGDFTADADLEPDFLAEKTLQFLRKHLLRYPKTDCALALSLKALYEGTSTSYQR